MREQKLAQQKFRFQMIFEFAFQLSVLGAFSVSIGQKSFPPAILNQQVENWNTPAVRQSECVMQPNFHEAQGAHVNDRLHIHIGNFKLRRMPPTMGRRFP